MWGGKHLLNLSLQDTFVPIFDKAESGFESTFSELYINRDDYRSNFEVIIQRSTEIHSFVFDCHNKCYSQISFMIKGYSKKFTCTAESGIT